MKSTLLTLRRLSVMVVATLALTVTGMLGGSTAIAKGQKHGREKWVASWAASAHGTYPVGTAVAQPNLSFAFPSPETGANNQTFRLIVWPTLWSDEFRLRFSNAFGTQRLREAYGDRVSLVNTGIGGNRILSPSGAGGPPALERLDRDVFSLSGISAVVWLEGINDLGGAGALAEDVIAGIQEGAQRIHDRNLKIIQATITSSLNSTIASYATPEVDTRRQTINTFIRTAGIFDSVADFDAVTIDPSTGELRPEFQPNSTTAAIDRLHPNRAGYLAMGGEVDIKILAPSNQKPKRDDENDRDRKRDDRRD